MYPPDRTARDGRRMPETACGLLDVSGCERSRARSAWEERHGQPYASSTYCGGRTTPAGTSRARCHAKDHSGRATRSASGMAGFERPQSIQSVETSAVPSRENELGRPSVSICPCPRSECGAPAQRMPATIVPSSLATPSAMQIARVRSGRKRGGMAKSLPTDGGVAALGAGGAGWRGAEVVAAGFTPASTEAHGATKLTRSEQQQPPQ